VAQWHRIRLRNSWPGFESCQGTRKSKTHENAVVNFNFKNIHYHWVENKAPDFFLLPACRNSN
jgi:hypothetical protein